MDRTHHFLTRRPWLGVLVTLTLTATAAWPQTATDTAAARVDYGAELRQLLPLAEQGHAIAQFNLGVMHDFGQGVRKDPQQALKWYRLAAAQGHGAAQFNLGGMYYEGVGVPRDLVRATMWFTLSAAAGVPGAAKNRGGIARMLSPTELAQARSLALACRQQSFKGCE